MSAQRKWKKHYNDFVAGLVHGYEDSKARRLMERFRREAALERKLEAMQRTIQAQAQAVAAEREACAKVAELAEDGHTNTYRNSDDDYNASMGYNEACSNIAAAIRARSK